MTCLMLPRPQMLALLSMLAATFFTLVYYPGVLYSDSYTRWAMVHQLLDPGKYGTEHLNTHLSVVPQLWMLALYQLTENYASFSWVQSCLFFFSSYLLLKLIAEPTGKRLLFWIPAAAITAFPLFQGYSVHHEMSVGTVVALNFFVVLTSRWRPGRTWVAAAAYLAVFLLVFSVLFGFRQNTLTILPVVAVYSWRSLASKRELAIQAGALVSALLTITFLPQALGLEVRDSSGIGFAWEIVQTLKLVDNPKYDDYLDYAAWGPRGVRGAFPDAEEHIYGSFSSEQGISFTKMVKPEIAARIRRDYLRLIVDEPRAFISNKLRLVKRMLGIGYPLWFYEFDENRWGRLHEFGYRYTDLRHAQFEKVHRLMEAFPIFLKPYLAFSVGALCLLALAVLRTPTPPHLRWLFVYGVAYYAAFFITTQSYEFRYFFFPFYYLVVICSFTAVVVARHAVKCAFCYALLTVTRDGSGAGMDAPPTPGQQPGTRT